MSNKRKHHKLERARRALDTRREGLNELQRLVEKIEDAIAEGRADDQEQLRMICSICYTTWKTSNVQDKETVFSPA